MAKSLKPVGVHSPKITKRRKRILQDILDEAADLFAKNGVEMVSVDQVIEEAGIAKSTFYTFFKGKDQLVASILAPIYISAQSGVESLEEDGLENLIEGLIEMTLDLAREYGPALELMGRIEPKYLAMVESEKDDYVRAFSDALSPYTNAPNLRGASTAYTQEILKNCAYPLYRSLEGHKNRENEYREALKALLMVNP